MLSKRRHAPRAASRADAAGPGRRLRLLLLCFFFLSGAASLLYQVAWQRMLGLHYGVGAISSAIVTSVFMLGLGIGSLLAGRARLGTREQATRAYMGVEVGIGLFGIASI